MPAPRWPTERPDGVLKAAARSQARAATSRAHWGGNRGAPLAQCRAEFGARAGRRTLNRYTLLGLVVGLVVGLFIGSQLGSSSPATGGMGAMGGIPSTPPGMPGGASQPVPVDNFQARITQMQQVLARDPKNAEAWIQLGNDFYDTRQPQKAIEAYDRALELRPNNPNVLTDQGVMFRDMGQFEKAIAKFQKANQIDPKHVQSLYNIGVVYLNDLKQPKKAIDAWNKVIQLAPQSDQAVQARAGIEEAKKMLGGG